MHDKGLVFEQGGERQIPEGLAEEEHEFLLVLDLNLIRESILVVGHLGLMISTIQMHGTGMLQLESIYGEQHLHGPDATVHEVAVEEHWIGGAGHAADIFEHVQEVEELAVQVPYYGDLGACGDCHALQRLLSLQQVEHIERHHVRVLHGQFALLLEEGKQVLHEGVVHGSGPCVLRPGVVSGHLEALGIAFPILCPATGLQSHPVTRTAGQGIAVHRPKCPLWKRWRRPEPGVGAERHEAARPQSQDNGALWGSCPRHSTRCHHRTSSSEPGLWGKGWEVDNRLKGRWH
mmetsp:Transcript_34997/g.74574  ORF Transcript_34997/g.74574 Transcript_34997/m.74574 type:complete len:290 (-) Transcript_34997:23-892(-)